MNPLERLRNGRRTDCLIGLAVLFFGIRAVVPVGYMPAPIAEGGPFALCQGTSAATLAMLAMVEANHSMHHGIGEPADHGGHSGHATGHTADLADQPGDPVGNQVDPAGSQVDPAGRPSGHDARWEHCPLGIGAADAAVGFALSLPSFGPAAVSRYFSVPELLALEPIRRFQARGPPA
jgi:hypothetical protein